MFHRIDVLRLDPLAAAPGRMGARRAQPDQVGAQAIDSRLEAASSDAVQRRIVQGIRASRRRAPAQRRRRVSCWPSQRSTKACGSASKASRRRMISARLGRRRLGIETHVEAETVEQLRAQFALFRVHRADQHETRRMPVGNAIALDQVDAAGGDVEQQVHQVVRQQVHFVDVEHAAVGLGQHAWGKPRATFAEGGVQVEAADDALLAGAQRQG